jgi:hypothetical protein
MCVILGGCSSIRRFKCSPSYVITTWLDWLRALVFNINIDIIFLTVKCHLLSSLSLGNGLLGNGLLGHSTSGPDPYYLVHPRDQSPLICRKIFSWVETSLWRMTREIAEYAIVFLSRKFTPLTCIGRYIHGDLHPSPFLVDGLCPMYFESEVDFNLSFNVEFVFFSSGLEQDLASVVLF